MRTFTLITFVCIAVLLFGSCGESDPSTSNASDIKKNVKPVADNEVAILEMDNSSAFGQVTIELYSNLAPLMVARFKELAREGVYNGVTFHRINQSVIQTGDPLSKDDDPANDGQGESDKPDVAAEFSDVPYDAGIVGAARESDFNSANSQFFITLKREPGFDNRYTVFGKVVEGMNNVRTIAGTPRSGERPLDDIRIKSIRIEPRTGK